MLLFRFKLTLTGSDIKVIKVWFGNPGHEVWFGNPDTLQLGQDYFAYIVKKDLPFAYFLTYHAFKSREGIVSRTNLAKRFKIG